MRLQIKISDHTYDVEIYDIQSRPIIVFVDGEAIEVWPEVNKTYTPNEASHISKGEDIKPVSKQTSRIHERSTSHSPNGNRQREITAPIPGVIDLIQVSEGDTVEVGQTLCIIEAMKMKNNIRSPRAGVIAQIHIMPHQTVQHKDILFTFND